MFSYIVVNSLGFNDLVKTNNQLGNDGKSAKLNLNFLDNQELTRAVSLQTPNFNHQKTDLTFSISFPVPHILKTKTKKWYTAIRLKNIHIKKLQKVIHN